MIYLSSGEPNRSERNRDRSYFALVYLRVAEQKVNCGIFIVHMTCMCVELVEDNDVVLLGSNLMEMGICCIRLTLTKLCY